MDAELIGKNHIKYCIGGIFFFFTSNSKYFSCFSDSVHWNKIPTPDRYGDFELLIDEELHQMQQDHHNYQQQQQQHHHYHHHHQSPQQVSSAASTGSGGGGGATSTSTGAHKAKHGDKYLNPRWK